VRLERQRDLRQAVTRDVVAELTCGSCLCPTAAFAQIAEGCTSSSADGTVQVGAAAVQLLQLGVSVPTMEKAVRAFDAECDGAVALGRLAAGCAEIAEDRLDHVLWQLFVAAGEDHRGALEVAALARAIDGGAQGAADPGGAGSWLRVLLDAETLAEGGEAVAQQLTHGGQHVTFEAFKEFVIHRHNVAFAARSASLTCRTPGSPRGLPTPGAEGGGGGGGRPSPRGWPEAALPAEP